MNDKQIRDAIRHGLPFFGTSSRGEILARYLPFGPVFKWGGHQIIPTPLQGGDLLWWLQAADEDDETG